MNIVEFKSIKKINIDFEKVFEFLFEKNILNYCINISFRAELKKNFLTEISYISSNNKEIKITYQMFFHPQKVLLFLCDIAFENRNYISQDKGYCRKGFSLKDYTTFRKLTFNENLVWHQINNYEEGEQLAKQLFEYVKEILLLDEMQKILFTDYWVNVPIDYSPYK